MRRIFSQHDHRDLHDWPISKVKDGSGPEEKMRIGTGKGAEAPFPLLHSSSLRYLAV